MFRNVLLSTLMVYEFDNTIFEEFRVPEGVSRETCINSILLETAELNVLYSAPQTLKMIIGIWTEKNFHIWEELEKTLHYEYNPIHNYDRTEESTDTLDGTNKQTRDLKGTDNFTRNLSEKAVYSEDNDTHTEFNNDSLHKVSAFNEPLVDKESEHTDGNSDVNRDVDSTNTITQTGTTNNDKTDTGTITDKTDNLNKHNMRAFGNIGVTTTQEMIKQQREISEFNIIDYIVNDFKTNFCVMIY